MKKSARSKAKAPRQAQGKKVQKKAVPSRKDAISKISKAPKLPSFGLQPLGDRVLVEEMKGGEKTTESGIYIPSSAKEDRGSKRGKVVAVGRGKTEDGRHVAVSVSVGDEVLYGWGDSVVYEGKEYTLVRDGDISAIIN